MHKVRLAQVIRAWSLLGAAAGVGAALILQDAAIMPGLAVLFFFSYMFATQWRERITEPAI